MKYITIFYFLFLLNYSLAKDLDKVSLRLSWLHQFQFAGYYMAKEKGFYQNAGLDVDIREYTYSTDQLQEVIDGSSTYAIGKSSLIINRLDNKPIIALAAIFQHSPLMLLTRADSNISTPKDLYKKKVMLTQDAKTTVAIHSMIVSQGLQRKDINFIPHSFNLDDLINGKTDAMGCYTSNEPYLMEKRGIKYNILHPKDYGFDFYGGILFTSEDELKNNPTRVNNFYNATLKGWEYAFNHIEESVDLIIKKYNTQNKTKEALIYEANSLKKFSGIDEGLLGHIDPKRIDEIKKIYLLLGFAQNSALEDFIYDPNLVYLTKEEKNYIKQNPIIKFSSTNLKPFDFIDNDTYKGILSDYLKLITKKTNLHFKCENSDMTLNSIENKRTKFKIFYQNSDTITEKTTLSTILTSYKTAIVTRADNTNIANIYSLNYQKVALLTNCPLSNKLKKNYPDILFKDVNSIEDGIKQLNNKEVSALFGTLPVLTYDINSKGYANIKISGVTNVDFNLKLIINKEDEKLKSIIDKAISKINPKEIQDINNKWIAVKYEKSKDYSLVYKIGIPLLLIIIFIYNSNSKLKKEIKKREAIEEELHKMANTDVLTKVANRRKINEVYSEQIYKKVRYKREFSILFFDIDDFKMINDRYGHDKADLVLVTLCDLIKKSLRNIDFMGRWGGEEFLIILPETNAKNANIVAQNLKELINNHIFPTVGKITCSFGVTEFRDEDDADSAITRVDNAMYYIKKNGKNGIKLA